jgi:hypothetical protein
MGKPKPGKLTEVDREAMTRAIEMARQRCAADCEQIEEMLRERPRHECGAFAAYSAQCHALGLRPWQTPPCELTDSDRALDSVRGDDDPRGSRAAARLLRRLREVGLSRYEITNRTASLAPHASYTRQRAGLAGAFWEPQRHPGPPSRRQTRQRALNALPQRLPRAQSDL